MKVKVTKVYIDKDSKERMMPGKELELNESRAKQLKDKGVVELIENARRTDKDAKSKEASVQHKAVATEEEPNNKSTEGALSEVPEKKN